jgi:putative DNA primase/helicase
LAKTKKRSEIDYDIERKEWSEELRAAGVAGVRAGSIDRDVERVTEELELEEAQSEFLQPVEPWPVSVDGAALLDAICEVYKSHIVMPKMCDTAIVLWTVHAHAHDTAQHSPILFITSPTKRCGKSNLLTTAGMLVPLPLSAANVTPATVFRAIDCWHPTMLIDEMDTFLPDKSDLRGVLNSGHMRSQAYVIRCVGDALVPKQFSTWCPKAFASIGRMHPTLEDRSITIGLKRKMPTEKIQRIPKDPKAYQDLRRKCVRWTSDPELFR